MIRPKHQYPIKELTSQSHLLYCGSTPTLTSPFLNKNICFFSGSPRTGRTKRYPRSYGRKGRRGGLANLKIKGYWMDVTIEMIKHALWQACNFYKTKTIAYCSYTSVCFTISGRQRNWRNGGNDGPQRTTGNVNISITSWSFVFNKTWISFDKFPQVLRCFDIKPWERLRLGLHY